MKIRVPLAVVSIPVIPRVRMGVVVPTMTDTVVQRKSYSPII